METPASADSKTKLENIVSWYLTDKLNTATAPIATVKFLTNDNLLVHLTRCNVAESAIPLIKVQVFRRVDGGVSETGYQLYNDQRFEKYVNNMLFGTSATGTDPNTQTPVTEQEAEELLILVNSLQTTARQTL
jgi:hypothetical protein